MSFGLPTGEPSRFETPAPALQPKQPPRLTCKVASQPPSPASWHQCLFCKSLLVGTGRGAQAFALRRRRLSPGVAGSGKGLLSAASSYAGIRLFATHTSLSGLFVCVWARLCLCLPSPVRRQDRVIQRRRGAQPVPLTLVRNRIFGLPSASRFESRMVGKKEGFTLSDSNPWIRLPSFGSPGG